MPHFVFKIDFTGLIQGVGFRPFIFHIASKLQIKGEVYNSSEGVSVILDCDEVLKDEFLRLLKQDLPPLAQIHSVKISKIQAQRYETFSIEASKNLAKTSPILSDFSFCKDCEAEFYDEKNPRFLYPFITCTNCGVRFSIIKKLPYDRANTTMSKFTMCEFCKSEYEEPKNRRFHAQPISCKNCKISVHLKDKRGEILASNEEAFLKLNELLKEDKIIAIKGLGGFHLCCAALNERAVNELRARKHRPSKPLAVLCKDLQMAETLAHISEKEREVLSSMIKPIVLLRKKLDLTHIARDTQKIGIMLAYTPLQLLIFKHFEAPLIATSANLSGECIIYDEATLRAKLGGVFDFYLDYDREIINASDDSIVQVVNDEVMILRASRGFAPYYLPLNSHFKNFNALALGSELKNCFALSFDDKIMLSPYIGDLKSVNVNERFHTLFNFFTQNYDFKPDFIIADKHPNFHYVKDFKIDLKVQHHYAHLCALLFEYEIYTEALGFCFDGTGFGDDAHIWGGEILRADLKEYERVGHFKEFKLISADISNISYLALALLLENDLTQEAGDFLALFSNKELSNLKKIHAQSKLYTSSLGRIIDAFGAIIFKQKKLEYEAQIGLLMEKYYDESLDYAYQFECERGEICIQKALKQALKDDIRHSCTGFLNGLAECIITFAKNYFSQDQKELPVLLCGGVFQNATLVEILKRKNFNFLRASKFASNDGAIALGQMAHFLYKGENGTH